MRVSETLNLAADLIEQRGWKQGPSGWDGGGSGELCVEGAIGAAIGIESMFSSKKINACPAGAAVREYLGSEVEKLWSWNDGVGVGPHGVEMARAVPRTAEEVVDVLRRCALIESVKEANASQVIPTSAAHVEAVAERYGLEVVEADGFLLTTRYVPELGAALVYQAARQTDFRTVPARVEVSL